MLGLFITNSWMFGKYVVMSKEQKYSNVIVLM